MWGWLGQLGNGLKKVGTGLKDGANKITHLGGGPDGNAGAPGAEMPAPTFQRPQMPAPGGVGAGFDPGASHLSTSVNADDIPGQVERPALPPAQYARPRLDQAGADAMWSPPPTLTPGPDPSDIASPVFTRQTGPTREQTPIPQLPGHPGDPRPYNPVIAGKYGFVMSHAKHNADGSYLDPADKEHGGGFKRDWKSIGKNFALSARQSVNQTMRNNPHASTGAILGSALGGGLGGGATAAISPEMGYENEFDQMHAPQMQADQQRVFTRQNQQSAQMMAQQEYEFKREQSRHLAAQTDALNSDLYGAGSFGTFNKKTGQPGFTIPAKNAPHYVDGTVNGVRGYYNAADPALAGKITPYDKSSANGADYGGLSGVGIFNRRTGEVTTPMEKSDKVDPHYSAGVENAIKKHAELKSQAAAADSAYQVAVKALKADPQNADIKASAEAALARREAAMQALNSHAVGVNQSYGDQLEGGVGDGGFGYVKRKAGGKLSSSQRTGNSLTRNVNDLPKF